MKSGGRHARPGQLKETLSYLIPPPGTGGPTYIIVWQCSCIVVYGMSVAFSGTDLEPDHHVVLVLKSRWRFNGQSWG